jgi:hypothetical protein
MLHMALDIQVVFEHGNEPLHSVKGGKFEQLEQLSASQEGLCSME